MSNERDNRGDIALWKPNSENPKAPQARGKVVAHRDIKEGEELDIALWRNKSDNEKAPVMTGKLSDKQESGGKQSGSEPDNSGYQSDLETDDSEPPF